MNIHSLKNIEKGRSVLSFKIVYFDCFYVEFCWDSLNRFLFQIAYDLYEYVIVMFLQPTQKKNTYTFFFFFFVLWLLLLFASPSCCSHHCHRWRCRRCCWWFCCCCFVLFISRAAKKQTCDVTKLDSDMFKSYD